MGIKERRIELLQIITEAKSLLFKLQDECPHASGSYVYGGNTGNWCESDDSYWRTYSCGNCGKGWTEYSENPNGGRNEGYYNAPEGAWKEAR